MNDYLWDRSGEPDEDVRRVEDLLATLRHRRPAPELPALPTRGPLRTWPLLAAAAGVLVALWLTLPASAPAVAWRVEWLDGAAWEEARVLREGRVTAGQSIETGAGRARIAVGDIGEVQLDPSTSVSLVDAGRRDHRLALVRGRLHATIWAPPGQFVVETPSATAVDLGCRYTLDVTEDGTGLLRVDAGWVGIEDGGRVALVPAGGLARLRRGRGPGTPHYEDASPAFRDALDVIDVGGRADQQRDAIAVVLAEARQSDAFSLWHLLTRTTGHERTRVFNGLAALVPPPPGVTYEGIDRGDRRMLEAWWDELGLGSAEFWRTWTSSWAGGNGGS